MTEDDRNMIHYFHTEKDDITRWCGWEDVKPECPELVHAMNQVTYARNALNSVVERIYRDDMGMGRF